MGCVKLHLLDQQYKNTELKVSYINKKLTLNNSAVNERRAILVNMIDPNGMWSDWVEDRQKRIYWDEQVTSQATTKAGETYVGKTVYATNGDGGFRYGDQYGNWHNSAPLPEISVTGFHISGSGPVSSAMRQAAQGYDPQWMVGFNKFVETGLTAINLTLTATTLAAEAGGFGGGSKIRVALNTVDDAAKTSTKLLNQFNSAESLIQGAGSLTKVKAGLQGFVKGDGPSIFKAITQGGTKQANGTILMQDGTTIFNHFSTKTGVYTIDINKAGQIYKIRIGQ